MSADKRHDAGDAHLEDQLQDAYGTRDSADLGPVAPGDAVGAAFGSWRRARRRRVAVGGSALVLLLGVGLWFFAGSRDGTSRGNNADAVAYARSLYDRLRTSDEGGSIDTAKLESDARLRDEYLAALDHPSSLVRRTAVDVLAYSKVAIPPERLERLLTEYREDLETPLELAGIGDASRVIATALERRRTATVQQVLRKIWAASSRGSVQVDPKGLLPFLEHDSGAVRGTALQALSETRSYVVGEKVRRLMHDDPERSVRLQAARLLIRHMGDDGINEVLDSMRTMKDTDMEVTLISETAKGVAFPELAHAKVADPDVEPVVGLTYARALARGGNQKPLQRLLPKVFAGSDPAAIFVGVQACREFERSELRGQALMAWKRLDRVDRTHITVSLIGWDLDSGDRARMLEAVERARVEGTKRLKFTLKRHLTSDDAEVRKAIRSLLDDWAADGN